MENRIRGNGGIGKKKCKIYHFFNNMPEDINFIIFYDGT